MTNGRMLQFWIVAILAVPAPALGADSLRHDLFARPLLASLTPKASDGVTGTEAPTTWSPRLTAVMVAGPNSMVTVDGTVVRIGEQVDGHTLLHVRDSAAVFIKNQQRIIVTMTGAGGPAATRGGK